jgi:hypothetical protein
MFVKVYRKEREREDNAVLFRAAQAKDRAEPEDDAREGTQVLLADTSQRLGREQTLRPRIKGPTALRHQRARSHYACTQSHTQTTLFATLTPPEEPLGPLSPLNSSGVRRAGCFS